MNPVIFLLLVISVSFCSSAIFFVQDNEKIEDPLNVKLTKLLEVEGKTNSWKSIFSKYLQSQNEETDTRKNDELPDVSMKLFYNADKTKVQQEQLNYDDLIKACKSIVGKNDVPICRLTKNIQQLSTNKNWPKSCREIQENGINKSGIYEIKPRTSTKAFAVLCDMNTNGGGWTHIQKRYDGSENFDRLWRDYKFGFGDLNEEFWLGLENIYHLSAFETSELLIELTDRDKKTAYAQYSVFAIGSEQEGYALKVLKEFTGDAGDALTHHLGSKFSTSDIDLDNLTSNCAQTYHSGWWFKGCFNCNLNGEHVNINLPVTYDHHGINWAGFRPKNYNLAGSRMLVRPIGVGR